MNSKSKINDSIRLFRTAPHACSYMEQRQAATIFVDPELTIDKSLNSRLSNFGYRRSGAHLYRPDCDTCKACIACRLSVNHFRIIGRHKRLWNRNQDLEVRETGELDDGEAFELYKRYINTRHRDGDMYPATREQFDAFIRTNVSTTLFYKFYLQGQLVAVSVTDVLDQGLSAVYTFFDPDFAKRSLGNYAILWQLEKARELQLQYVFLGYWIKDCAKMQYKSTFRPIEMLVEGKWLVVK